MIDILWCPGGGDLVLCPAWPQSWSFSIPSTSLGHSVSSPSLEGLLPLTAANPVTLFCLLKVSSHFVCFLKKWVEIPELPLLLGHLPVISWSGKLFKPNHSSLFKISCNYEVEINSCREHLTNSSKMYHCGWCDTSLMSRLRDSKHNSFLFKHVERFATWEVTKSLGAQPLQVSPGGLSHQSLG